MMLQFDIQPTTEADWRELKSIRLQSLLDAPTAFGLSYESVAAYSDAEWQDRAANRTPPVYFIARAGKTAVGLVGGVKTPSDYNLIAMWVAPSHRGLGIAKALVAHVLAAAKQSGAESVSLFVSPQNTSAAMLYQSMGFYFTPHFETLQSFPDITIQRMIAQLKQDA